jgi:hypothetical protein
MVSRGVSAALALGVFWVFALIPANAASFFEKSFWLSGPRYDGVLPPCEYLYVLERIQERFASKEYRFWNSDLQIIGFQGIRETAFRPWAAQTIPRRFCSAIALTSDGISRPLHYSIGEDTGMIGASWGVEWCVVGTDRNWSSNPSCSMARP